MCDSPGPESDVPEGNADRAAEAKIRARFSGFDPNIVFSTVHPVEAHASFGARPLSIIQKAITCCIQELGGSATDAEVLAFVRFFWDEIVKRGERLYKGIPDKRILHVAFSNKRFGVRLFLPCEGDPSRFVINNIDKTDHQAEKPVDVPADAENILIIPEGEMDFDERVLQVVTLAARELTLAEITEACKGHEWDAGPFRHLSLELRVRACLIAKKIENEVSCSLDTKKWKARGSKGRGKLALATYQVL